MRYTGLCSLFVVAAVCISETAVLAAPQTAPGADDLAALSNNQLGLLEYCQAQGYIDGKAIVVQKKLMSMLPAVSDANKMEIAYQKGKKGTVAALDKDVPLADAAARKKTDVANLCQHLGGLIVKAGENLPK